MVCRTDPGHHMFFSPVFQRVAGGLLGLVAAQVAGDWLVAGY